MQIDIVSQGFPGKAATWFFGWGAVYLIRTGGRLILADAGGPAITPLLVDKLAALSVKPEAIDAVLLTHLHFDHAYNLAFFPDAEFVVGKDEWEAANDPGNRDPAGYYPACAYLRDKKVRLVARDGEEIYPDIAAAFVPGHTPGSLAFLLHTDAGTAAVTGDAVKNRSDLHYGVYAGNASDLDQASASVTKVKALASLVYPGHDCPLKLENGIVTPLEDNRITVLMPKGILVNGKPEMELSLGHEF